MQKPERRLAVRRDVEPLPPEVAGWFPAPVAAASEALEEALDRREENGIAFEIAEGDARSAARANEAAEDEAILAGKPIPAADRKSVDAFDAARRSMHAADRVAAAAVDHYLRTLDAHSDEIGALIGGRIAGTMDQARQHLAAIDAAFTEWVRLDRLSNVLREPRSAGTQPMATTAWGQPMPSRHGGLEAVNELFNIVGGRDEVLAA
jgi:hypothetical protein